MSDPCLTEAQAKAAFESVKAQFKEYREGLGYEPELIKNWDWLDTGPKAWAIVWETGPSDWSYRSPDGGRDWEHTHEMQAILGYKDAVVDTPAAPDFPAKVRGEAVNSWALALYPA